MKKELVIASLVLCAFGFSVSAQDTTGMYNHVRATKTFGPLAGQHAISIDATPVLNYAGNFMSGSVSQNTMADQFYVNGFGMYGKMYTTASLGYRFGLNLGFVSEKNRTTVVPGLGPNDDEIHNAFNIGITVGMEKRMGTGRVQGVCGPLFAIGYSMESWKADYETAPLAGTETEVDAPATFNVGAGGFAGIEFFLCKQISLGAEFNLMLTYSVAGKAVTKINDLPDVDKIATSRVSLGFGQNAFVPSGRTYLSFYF